MRSFAVIAGFAAAANAMTIATGAAYATPTPIGYEADAPIYPVASSTVPEDKYPVVSSVVSEDKYPVASSAVPEDKYPVASSAVHEDKYPVASSAVHEDEYPAYTTSAPSYDDKHESKTPIGYSTTVISSYEVDCPEPTTVEWNSKTYTITKSTKLVIEEPCTTTVPVYASSKSTYVPSKPTSEVPHVPSKPSTIAYVPSGGSPKPNSPAHSAPAAPYYPVPANGTVSKPPVHPTGTGVAPSSTKPTLPEHTGAAAQMGVGMLAIIGAVAAFL